MPNLIEVPRPRTQRKISWDVMRVVAIYAVMIQHITHQAPINHPELGPYPFVVPLEFGASTLLVISAFFVCVTVRRGSTRKWLWHRLARLLPAYVIAVFGTYVITRVGVATFQHYRFDGLGGLLFGQPVSGNVVGGPPRCRTWRTCSATCSWSRRGRRASTGSTPRTGRSRCR